MAGRSVASRGAIGRHGQGSLSASRIRLEKGGVGDIAGDDVIAHDDHAQADIRQVEQALGKGERQAHATVRGGVARQHTGVQGDARPRDALHEGHVAVFIDIGLVDRLLLHDAVDAGGGLVAGRSGRDRRLQDLALGIVDRDPLVAQRDDGKDRRACATGLGEFIALSIAAAPARSPDRCCPSPPGRARAAIARRAMRRSRAGLDFMSETSEMKTYSRRHVLPLAGRARSAWPMLVTGGYSALATRKPAFSTRMPPAVA